MMGQIRSVIIAKLTSELLPVADRRLFEKSELYFIASFCDRFESICLFLRDGLVVAELCRTGAVIAGTDNDSLDITGNDACVHEDLLHVNGVLGDQEIFILGSQYLGRLCDELVDRPDESLLVRSALVCALEDGVLGCCVVDCDQSCAGLLQ